MSEAQPAERDSSAADHWRAGSFDVPVVLLLFLREEGALKIVDRLREVKATRVYLMSDQGRTSAERVAVARLRARVERAIDWDCQLVRNYADENRGVYGNIALGAKWVFLREESAIFLEDDNIPEISFFRYCSEMLDRFRNDSRVLWVCGTNYLGDYNSLDGPSYYFTRHLLPCGWASWSSKFLHTYDFDLSLTDSHPVMDSLPGQYEDVRLLLQQMQAVQAERRRRDRHERYSSWDHHMTISLRANGLLGIAPARNQILNVGADVLSTHGGSSLEQEMTRRFCGMSSYPLHFPLRHPVVVEPDPVFERALGKVILLPLRLRMRARARRILGRILSIDPDTPLALQPLWRLLSRSETGHGRTG